MPDWTAYLQNARRRLGKKTREADPSRSAFQRDYDRIIFSAPFRRLQNKTQVMPAPKSDEVRNRLTHSLETASVGRSLGFLAGQFLIERYPELQSKLKLRPDDFGYMVSAAALAHDIGNPPFGHEGEKAVRDFFHSDTGKFYLHRLTPKQQADFLYFEGNAAGLRILAHTTGNNHALRGGLRLSLGTYGAFVKYPKEALPFRHEEGKRSLKKFGIFQAELKDFEEIARQLQLIPRFTSDGKAWARFPLAFLTEAADDICYTVIDYEDAFHLGLTEEKRVTELLGELARLNRRQQATYKRIAGTAEKVAYLRSYAINRLINETVEVFLRNEEAIRSGAFDTALTDALPSSTRSVIKEILSESITKFYHHPTVLKNEAGGKTVIPFLLEKFLQARFNPGKFKQYELLLPEIYRQSETDYEKVLDTVMFVTGMSDRQAVEWYRNFNGIQLAEY